METSTNEYFDQAAESRRLPKPTHPGVIANFEALEGFMRQHITIDKDTQLLEIGCGWGAFTYHFDRMCDTFGIDASEKMLAINPVKKTARMSATALEFEDNSFDVVFVHNVLHHIPEMQQAVAEMARVSRGFVVIAEPNRRHWTNFLLGLLMKEERLCLRFTPKYLHGMAETAGLEVLESFAYGMWTPMMTPRFMMPLIKATNFRQPWGIENVVIARK